MPYATLVLSAKRIVGPTTYRKGERVPVSAEWAVRHKNDEFFKIDLSDTSPGDVLREAASQVAEEAEADARPPEKPSDPKAIIKAIQGAYKQIDSEDATKFTNAGKPKATALTSILGWTVTADERDVALGYDDEDEGLATGGEEASVPKRKVTVKHRVEGEGVEV